MKSMELLELEIEFLEKKKKAMDSDLRFKSEQYDSNMPCDEGMFDDSVARLVMLGLVRDRDKLDVEIAEKKLELAQLSNN